ncbi:MAG TPA: DPP IV N-terminal domain-containing protein, partial [Chitinophagaceae bacterium]
MQKWIGVVLLSFISAALFAQQSLGKLTVEKIMRNPKWIGTSPSNVQWSDDGQHLYFDWNPDNAPADSLYSVTLKDHHPTKLTVEQKRNLNTSTNIVWNETRTAFVYEKGGDIFLKDVLTGKTKRIVQTTEEESNPVFSFDNRKIVFTSDQNLYAWDIATGETMQLTNLSTMAAGQS